MTDLIGVKDVGLAGLFPVQISLENVLAFFVNLPEGAQFEEVPLKKAFIYDDAR